MILSILKPRWSFSNWFRTGLYLVIAVSLVSGLVGWQLVRPASRGESLVRFEISDGSTANEVSTQLFNLGLISSKFWFEAWLWLSGRETKIVRGSYSLPQNVNIINLSYLITGGLESGNEVTVRLIEGWTIEQMAEYFEGQGLFTSADFKAITNESSSINQIRHNWSGDLLRTLSTTSLEGYLFPDTYRVYADVAAYDMVLKMLTNLDKKFLPEWRNEAEKQGYTIHQVLTMASIVEKEVSGTTDRKIVADIFWKRLRANIGLQADSTVNYVTGKSSPAASSEDLQVDSAYNTYKYRGLPPGPIASPSSSAIEATLYPEPNDYWYFLTTPQGEVIYSKTFEQHRQAKLKYLR